MSDTETKRPYIGAADNFQLSLGLPKVETCRWPGGFRGRYLTEIGGYDCRDFPETAELLVLEDPE
ncbi:hypothetical protein J6590_106478, partial [Homalodisca vitripennis]